MPVERPPLPIVRAVHNRLPGVYHHLIRGLLVAAQPFDGVRLTSWWRTPEHNRAVGGHPESQHLVGLAFDLVAPPLAMHRIAQRARDVGLVAVNEGDHVHLQALQPGQLARFGVLAAALA